MAIHRPENRSRAHERSHFFKYTSAPAAKMILANQTLKWSAPTEFNDPFDVPRQIAAEVAAKDIAQDVSGRFISMLINTGVIQLSGSSTEEDLRELIEKDLETHPEAYEGFAESLNGLRAQWKEVIPEFRILCLSETKDNTAMWHHYANAHTGVVLRFEASDFHDSPSLLAQPVRYVNELPSLEDAAGWAQGLLGEKPFGPRDTFREYCYIKTEEWKTEREWRVVSFARDEESGTVSFYKFAPQTLSEIYLGQKITNADKEDILSMLTHDFAHTVPFQAKVGAGNRLNFQELAKN